MQKSLLITLLLLSFVSIASAHGGSTRWGVFVSPGGNLGFAIGNGGFYQNHGYYNPGFYQYQEQIVVQTVVGPNNGPAELERGCYEQGFNFPNGAWFYGWGTNDDGLRVRTKHWLPPNTYAPQCY